MEPLLPGSFHGMGEWILGNIIGDYIGTTITLTPKLQKSPSLQSHMLYLRDLASGHSCQPCERETNRDLYRDPCSPFPTKNQTVL